MKYDHGKMMVDPEELNLALSLADEAGEQLSQLVVESGGWLAWTPQRSAHMAAVAQVAQAREARALRLTLAQLADDHEYNADRRADR